MSQQLDIMKLEPMANVERRLVTVVLTDHGMIEIEPADAGTDRDYWIDLLSRIAGVDPSVHPHEFFDALPARLDGTYVYARAADSGRDRDREDVPHAVGA